VIKKQIGGTAVVVVLMSTLSVAPAFAGEKFEGDDKKVVKESLAYLYMKLDVKKPAAFANSGVQNLVARQDGLKFLTVGDVKLPASVCGDGWALQFDLVKYDPTVFVVPVSFKPPATPFSDAGVLVGAKHVDLKLAACVVPVQPADRTVRTVLYSDIECFDGWVEDVVQVETFSTRYDSETNLWVEFLLSVTEVRENNRLPTVEQCDLDIILPVMPPEYVPEPVVQPTPATDLPVVTALATPATLAVTGSTNIFPAMLLALLLMLAGFAATMFTKRKGGTP